jgi:hypothetical protein
VEGVGNYIGVYGHVPSSSTSAVALGVYAESDSTAADSLSNFEVLGYSAGGNGNGVGAEAGVGYGMYATSTSNYAVYAVSSTGNALYAQADSTGRWAIIGESSGGRGVYGYDASGGYGVYGTSSDVTGVAGYTTTGSAVFGEASTDYGFAGNFQGNVIISKTLIVGATKYSSDKNLKTDVRQIDSKDLLGRVSHLPISSWTYKSDPQTRHIGPMAQDFHAAFGLDGSDETHISEVDIAGVSLAAIQELDNQIKARDAKLAQLEAESDAQIAELTAKLNAQTQTVAESKQQFSVLSAALAELNAVRAAANR